MKCTSCLSTRAEVPRRDQPASASYDTGGIAIQVVACVVVEQVLQPPISPAARTSCATRRAVVADTLCDRSERRLLLRPLAEAGFASPVILLVTVSRNPDARTGPSAMLSAWSTGDGVVRRSTVTRRRATTIFPGGARRMWRWPATDTRRKLPRCAHPGEPVLEVDQFATWKIGAYNGITRDESVPILDQIEEYLDELARGSCAKDKVTTPRNTSVRACNITWATLTIIAVSVNLWMRY